MSAITVGTATAVPGGSATGRIEVTAMAGGASLALNFVINYEEGSEPLVGGGNGFTEVRLAEVARSPVPRGERDLAAESMFE